MKRKTSDRVKTMAIVAGAGWGKRLGAPAKKPFVRLGSKPLIVHCLEALGASSSIDGIIVAVERSCIKQFRGLVAKHRLRKIADVVAGGKTRFESVGNCLKKIDASCDIVLIHDAARPFLEERLIRDSIAAARRFGASLAAVPEKDTVKAVRKGKFVDKTLDRSGLWRAETPQTFRRSIIMEAYRRRPVELLKITDDSCLVEAMGRPVRIVRGSYNNIKITTPEDLALAEALLKNS